MALRCIAFCVPVFLFQAASGGAQPTSPVPEVRLLRIHSRIYHNERLLRVLLPPGYHSTSQLRERYAVLYLNDGQDLLDPHTSTFHNGSWLLRQRMLELICRHAGTSMRDDHP
jgi:enterochelin esterase-like enzyme